jgi:Terminase RNaseH-like domain
MVKDFTVMSVLDVTDREQRRIERFNMIDYHLQTERLMMLVEAYKPVAIVAELNAMGIPLAQDLQRRGLPVYGFTTTSMSKKIAIEGLALALERGHVKLLADAIQKGELLVFEAQPLPSGMVRYTAPDGGHDDTVMALAMAWHAVTHGAPTEPIALHFG